ncbi:hypothetical protein CEXT_337391 [Caerostris extrusa]|uniref:Uncharacterized protein n=1 Tax=Caerostris extrusa TaxID=172846 RepID=A0AAV4N0J3_CAEEX|nr:hypothetical protein CEXT_337391 [Caerostris extrusa]
MVDAGFTGKIRFSRRKGKKAFPDLRRQTVLVYPGFFLLVSGIVKEQKGVFHLTRFSLLTLFFYLLLAPPSFYAALCYLRLPEDYFMLTTPVLRGKYDFHGEAFPDLGDRRYWFIPDFSCSFPGSLRNRRWSDHGK